MKKTRNKSHNSTTLFKITLDNTLKKKTFDDRNAIAKKIFEFLVQENELNEETIALCTSDGKTLSSFPVIENLSKNQDIPYFYGVTDSHNVDSNDTLEFNIIADSTSEKFDKIKAIERTMQFLLSLFNQNEQLRDFIFQGLDALPNSICVYDKDVRLLYANADFCNYIKIKNRKAALGKPIDDILLEDGIKFTSTKKPRGYLKVKDVLKYGKPVIDWEVEVTSTVDPDEYMIASNDMYPLFDDKGQISGIAEISRSRNRQISQVRDTLGLAADYTFEDIIGNSPKMNDAKQLAMSFALSPYNVLIYGESGVGKELFAQSIHNYSERRNKPFVAINCASISPELIDSELFGYESGAFTGASKNGHVGKFELANGGTLFLDEVAELPAHAQTKLLRALETKTITRVGGTKNIAVDVRVVAATNRSLEKMIEDGLFREDLYYRLMVLNITIPPLRERSEDILPCCKFFMKQTRQINNFEVKTLDEKAKRLLTEYDWPGNCRELRNVISRVYVMSNSSIITYEDVLSSLQSSRSSSINIPAMQSPVEAIKEKRTAVDISQVELLKETLLITKGNKTEAAKLLGISRKTLYNMLEKYKKYFDQN